MNTYQRSFSTDRFSRISDEKRERILDAAIDEFSTRGFAAANTNRIAERSGISVGSLFQYFPTKEDLYLTVVHLGATELRRVLEPILHGDGDLFAKLREIVLTALHMSDRDTALTRLYLRFTTEADPLLAERLAEHIESFTAAAYTELLADAQRRGVVKNSGDARVLAFCLDNILLGIQFSASSPYYRSRKEIFLGPEASIDPQMVADEIVAFLHHAL